jgi:hypothetical protein
MPTRQIEFDSLPQAKRFVALLDKAMGFPSPATGTITWAIPEPNVAARKVAVILCWLEGMLGSQTIRRALNASELVEVDAARATVRDRSAVWDPPTPEIG